MQSHRCTIKSHWITKSTKNLFSLPSSLTWAIQPNEPRFFSEAIVIYSKVSQQLYVLYDQLKLNKHWIWNQISNTNKEWTNALIQSPLQTPTNKYSTTILLDTWRKLNLHEMLRRFPEHLMYVPFYSLYPGRWFVLLKKILTSGTYLVSQEQWKYIYQLP